MADVGNPVAQQPKLTVHVIAFGSGPEDKEVKDEFHMTARTNFRVLMKAWCDRHGVPLEAAEFEWEGHILRPDESPTSRGWTLEQGVVEVFARPARLLVRVVAEIAGMEERTEFRVGPDDPLKGLMCVWCCEHGLLPEQVSCKIAGSASCLSMDTSPTSLGWMENSTPVLVAIPRHGFESTWPSTLPDGENTAVSVSVVADHGGSQDTFNAQLRLRAPLQFLIQAWCEHHNVDQLAVRFLLDDRCVVPGDTLESLGQGKPDDAHKVIFLAEPYVQTPSGATRAPKGESSPRVQVLLQAVGALANALVAGKAILHRHIGSKSTCRSRRFFPFGARITAPTSSKLYSKT